MKCSKCQSELKENARFCTVCGCKVVKVDIKPGFNDMQPANQSDLCVSCGAQLMKGVRFCTVCGTRIGSSAPSLVRLRDNTATPVDRPEFMIGKKQDAVNCCITDNKAVSRVHAKIVNAGGQFRVVDLASTNHTYVDGVQIPANMEVPIANGTRLRFANEEFVFRTM